MQRLLVSMTAYVDYVVANHEGYLSLVKAAAGGNETLREIYEEARSSLNGRVFREDAQGTVVPDTPATRLVVRGWSAMVEELVLSWIDDDRGLTREQLIDLLAVSLPALVEVVPG
jgi:hypothetical protein